MDEGSAPKPAILVSACLLGVCCNHRGEANTAPNVAALAEHYRLVAICPETAGGLPTPRAEATIRPDSRVVNQAGMDVTDAFERGAAAALQVARAIGANAAVLKARSPSCGAEGITTRALLDAGLHVESEEDVASRTMA